MPEQNEKHKKFKETKKENAERNTVDETTEQ